jgi:hypothetical protein
LLHALVVMADSVGDDDGRFRADGEQIARRLGINEAEANAVLAQLRSDQAIVPDRWPDGKACWRIALGAAAAVERSAPGGGPVSDAA